MEPGHCFLTIWYNSYKNEVGKKKSELNTKDGSLPLQRFSGFHDLLRCRRHMRASVVAKLSCL